MKTQNLFAGKYVSEPDVASDRFRYKFIPKNIFFKHTAEFLTCLLLLDMQHLVAWVLTASRVEFQETNSDFHCIVIISCPYIIGIKHSYMQ